MSASVLVAYATKYGSTQEVADSIASRLAASGFACEAKPARQVNSLEGYDAVVLAAPFYIGSLLKDARQFLDRYRPELEQMPVALATLGPLRREDDLDDAREQLDSTLEKMEWLKPRAAEMFIGKYDPRALRGLDKLIPSMPTPLKGVGAHDDRDWDAIAAWADSLPEALGLQS